MSRSGTAFGRYSMSGGRFEEAEGLPLSAIGELKNYKDLIDDVAARLYKREHPRKKNLPSGFSRDIDIRLTGIKHGCVVVEMTRYQHETSNQIPLWDEDAPDFAETARKMINSTIRSIKQAKDPASIGDFPPESLSRLYRLGKSLNEDEKITLAEADNSGRIDVDSDWKDIISRSTESQFVERVIDGKLVGMDASEEWFTYTFLIYTSQKIIRGKADISRWDDFYKFFNNRSRARMCSLSVVCKINDDCDIESIEQTYGIEETLPEKFTSRLEALAQLSTGWYGTQDGVPQGEPIKDSIFKNVQSFLCEALSYTSSIPQIIDLVIFPQINGGIQIEWKELDYEVDFEPDDTINAFDFSKNEEDCEKMFAADCSPNEILNWMIGGELND
ncbi:Uncharacterised protein [Bifidobacterium catenulatum]|nr:Uncharacterised protein [Bifidobacterium catenulatum]